jgi:hypothetical protein
MRRSELNMAAKTAVLSTTAQRRAFSPRRRASRRLCGLLDGTIFGAVPTVVQ